MDARITVPPTLMERVEHQPTSAVPFIRRIELAPYDDAHDRVPANALTFGAALVEAVMSSAIEGIRTTVTQAALAYVQPRHPHVTASGQAVASALHATFDAFAGKATYADHRAAHTRLMRGQGTRHYAGGYRQVGVRISDHVAPAPRRLPGLMEDLTGFVEDREATVLHAAVAHAQFEAIHPYPDGNGRIGRALLSAHLGVPVSPHLFRYRHRYYDALRDYRLGDATAIVNLVSEAAHDGFEVIENTFDYDLIDGPRTLSPRAWKAEQLVRQVPVGSAHRMLRSTSATTRRGFDELVEHQLVEQVSDGGPDPVYAYIPIVQQWIRVADTDPWGSKYFGKWRERLGVHV